MNCKRCDRELNPDWMFCPYCGRAIVISKAPKKRGNGQGSVFQLENGKYMASVVLSSWVDENGKRHKKTRSRVFDRKKDALAALPELRKEPKQREMTFRQLYDKWEPTHRAGKSTMDCYHAAVKYFEPVFGMKMSEIDIDDLQECVDECPHGKRTRENMRAVCGLIYKFGIPRKVIPDNLNLASYLIVSGDAAAHRSSFDRDQIEEIKNACGKIPHAEDIYCMIYTGFRPSEFLALTADSYDPKRDCLTGGAKTQAGTDRIVTVSPKIREIIQRRAKRGGFLFDRDGEQWKLRDFTEYAFHPTLELIGIDNPIIEISGGVQRHMFTPHSCRHTFATLLKDVAGSDKDKLELIGHTSSEMLRYYQDAPIEGLHKITDQI
jgi:integrase